jgi:hypothetical protein
VPHNVFARGSDPFRAADWKGQVVYLVQGQMLASMADGTSRVLVGWIRTGVGAGCAVAARFQPAK